MAKDMIANYARLLKVLSNATQAYLNDLRAADKFIRILTAPCQLEQSQTLQHITAALNEVISANEGFVSAIARSIVQEAGN